MVRCTFNAFAGYWNFTPGGSGLIAHGAEKAGLLRQTFLDFLVSDALSSYISGKSLSIS